MAHLLAMLMLLPADAPRPPVAVTAEARVSVVRAHRAGPDSWQPKADPRQREVRRREKEGTIVRLRLTEFE